MSRGPAVAELADVDVVRARRRSWGRSRRLGWRDLGEAALRCSSRGRPSLAASISPLLDEVAAEAEAAVLEHEGLVLVGDEAEAVGAAEVEEALAVLVLAEHPGGVQVAPLGEVLVDPDPLGLDEVLDLLVGDLIRGRGRRRGRRAR